jgi:hypothetical protein
MLDGAGIQQVVGHGALMWWCSLLKNSAPSHSSDT